ncbi:MAG: hypothetical protein C4348_01810 [Patescibacteria group bacterium]
MNFYLENSYLKLPAYLRILLRYFKKVFNLLIIFLTFSFLLIYFKENLIFKNNLFFLFSLLALIEIVLLIINKNPKEDLRVYNPDNLNLDNLLNNKARNLILDVITYAEINKTPNDLFYLLFLKELINQKEVAEVIEKLEVKKEEILKEIESYYHNGKNINDLTNQKNYIDLTLFLLKKSYEIAYSFNYHEINNLIIFTALASLEDPFVLKILEKFDIKKEHILINILMDINKNKKIKFDYYQPVSVFHTSPEKKRIFNPALTSKTTPILDSYGDDLTLYACQQNLGILIGHKEEFENLINKLVSGKNNILLIGEDGSGRETIVFHLAWRIHNELVPKELLDYRLVKLDLSLLYSEDREKFLSRLTTIIKEVIDSGHIILFFPEIHQTILEPYLNVMQILNPILNSKSIPIIASTTPLGYIQMQQKVNIDYLFEKIEVKEITENEAMIVLSLKAILWENQYKVKISSKAIYEAIKLCKTFIKQKPLPKSAEDIILESINLVKSKGGNFVNQELIRELVSSITKIPIKEAIGEEKEKLINLEDLIHQRLVNQEEAIKAIARVLKIYRAGLEKKKGVIGAFLFVGPTGVGKTETAKVLAKIYYGSENNMIRLDMVEFQTPEDLEKLIGSKDGKILGQLTEPIRQNPYSLILLDEFEKTHPTILKIFLPIFDEGLIKDALGREVDFRNSLIICTSNAYSEEIKKAIEEGQPFEEVTENIKSKLTPIFSVELINRFDAVVVYKPLGQKELMKIAEILFNDLKTELLMKHGIELEISEKALEEIVKRGTDPIFGARPLKRKIEEIVKARLAEMILKEEIKRGMKVFIDFEDDFQFKVLV